MKFDDLYQSLVSETIGMEAASTDEENILRMLNDIKEKAPESYRYIVDQIIDTVDNLDNEDSEEEQDPDHGSYDMSDDAEALASAGFGTDEDYGDYGGDDY